MRLTWLAVVALVLGACGDNLRRRDTGGDGGLAGDARDSGTSGDSGVDAAIDGPVDAACNAPNIVCAGQCLDPNTTDTHCGGCGTDCTLLGQVCTDAICCNAGEINSGGHCCPAGDHYDNGLCCASGQVNVGTLCCATGEIDSNGHCCAAGAHWDNGTCCNGTDLNVGGSASPLCCPDATYLDCAGSCVPAGGNNANCGGCPGMGGTDCTTSGEQCSNGHCCAPSAVWDNGICCRPGYVNVGGTAAPLCCASATDLNCNGTCVDPQATDTSCGGCVGAGGVDCTATSDVCASGICCAVGQHRSNSLCCNAGTDDVGGICCAAGQINASGICCAPGQVNGGGTPSICCAAGQVNCGGSCVDENTSAANCGACGNTCTSGTSCLSGHCCANGDNLCGGTCSDPNTDDQNCGGCGTDCTTAGKQCSAGICCASGQYNSGGVCCPTGKVNVSGICCNPGESNCSGSCVNEQNDTQHCGSCTKQCTGLELCASGNCSSTCSSPNIACPMANPTICTDPRSDDSNCGACGTTCTGGENCTSSTCSCPTTAPDFCSMQCTDTAEDPNNCGACGAGCVASQHCDIGHCCNTGTTYCASTSTCSNLQSDAQNCGTCGNACGSGQTCVNGACACPFGEIACGNSCKVATVDTQNCGACGNVCGSGVNAGKPYCVSNSCVAACPSPLCGVGTGAAAACVNTADDNQHCGNSCPGTACTGGKVCSAGTCVTPVTTSSPPAKCVGAGPPISVPTTGGGSVCTGNLGAVNFTFGLCSCTSIGPLSQVLQTDAFDSSIGSYIGPGWAGTACNTASDCAKSCSTSQTPCAQDSNCPSGQTCTRYPIACVNHTCTGGGVGTNGTESNSQLTQIGGDLWTYATTGLSAASSVTVLRRVYDNGPLTYGHAVAIYGDSHVHGAFSGGSTAKLGVAPVAPDTGTLYEQTTACGSLPTSMTLSGNPTCVQQTVTFNQPCDCNSADLVPVRAIVQHFATTANNDDAAIGISPTLLASPATALRLDLACGYYYFTAITSSHATTIYVHGHVGIFISGALATSQPLIFDLDPTATLDIFVGGAIQTSQQTLLGSPAFPRQTRIYVGSPGCAGGNQTCTVAEDCCSGVCTGGKCVGGGQIQQSINLSQTGSFDGLMWAGYGTFVHSNSLTMYGAIFANHFDASAPTIIHYDSGIVSAPNECPAPSGTCDSCRDCANNPCIGGQCQTTCASDLQCCPPLTCRGGTCHL